MMTDTNPLVIWLGGGAFAVLALVAVWVAMRGRPIAGEHVFRASRWSRGNHLFPTQVLITLGLLALARVGVFIPIPGVNLAAVAGTLNAQKGTGFGEFLGVLDMFSGGGFPPNTLLVIERLAHESYLLEIQTVAAL